MLLEHFTFHFYNTKDKKTKAKFEPHATTAKNDFPTFFAKRYSSVLANTGSCVDAWLIRDGSARMP